MSQIDVILKYTNRAAAIADLGPYAKPDENDAPDLGRDQAIPNVQVWRDSQDVAGVHNYMSGYFVCISLPRIVAALRDNAAVQVVIDRDKANARQAGAIIRSTVGALVLQDLRFSPVFAGANYPFGDWK